MPDPLLPASADATPAAPPPAGTRSTLDRVLAAARIVGAVALAAWLLWFFARLVAYLAVAALLAYLMRPLVDRLQAAGLGRVPAIVVAFAVYLGGLGVLLTYLLPFLAQQLTLLNDQMTQDALRSVAADLEARLQRVLPIRDGVLIASVSEVFEALFREGRLQSVLGSLVDVFSDVVFGLLVVPFVAFFLLKDGARIRNAMLDRVPNRYFEIVLGLVEQIEQSLGRYFRALFAQCTAVAVLATILLYVVGLDAAVAVGLFTGLANSIPYFGPIVGLLAGTVVGVVQTGDFSLFAGILVAMILTQATDNLFFQPFIFSRAARTHPLGILIVVLIGAQVAGIIGMLLAIPLMTTLRVTIAQVRWSMRNYRTLQSSP